MNNEKASGAGITKIGLRPEACPADYLAFHEKEQEAFRRITLQPLVYGWINASQAILHFRLTETAIVNKHTTNEQKDDWVRFASAS